MGISVHPSVSVPEMENSMLGFLGQRAEAKDDEKFAKEIQKSAHKSLRMGDL